MMIIFKGGGIEYRFIDMRNYSAYVTVDERQYYYDIIKEYFRPLGSWKQYEFSVWYLECARITRANWQAFS